MMVGTRALVPRLREKADLHFDVFPLPSLGRARTLADITGYCVVQGHRAPAASGRLPGLRQRRRRPRRSWRRPARWCPPTSRPCTRRSSSSPSRFPRNAEVFDQVIRRADPMPSAPGWPDVVSQTQPFLDRMFYSPGARPGHAAAADRRGLRPAADAADPVGVAEPVSVSRLQARPRRPRRDVLGPSGSRRVSGSRVSSTCQGRAPSSARRAATASPVRGSSPSSATGGSHITRRT